MRLLFDTNIWAIYEKGYEPVINYIQERIKEGREHEFCMSRMIQHELLSIQSFDTEDEIKHSRLSMIEMCESFLKLMSKPFYLLQK